MKKTKNQAQIDRFKEMAKELECDESEENFDSVIKTMTKTSDRKTCPECGHVFKGNGWDGIDAHWRSRHEDAMPYEEAWPLLKAGKYNPK